MDSGQSLSFWNEKWFGNDINILSHFEFLMEAYK